ncbi:MAG: DNA primase [Ruminococcus sp.]|nr:DNA primase [Ruminococcus sp.]
MALNDDFLYDLRTANPMEDIARSYVSLKRSGRNYVCSCPFHSEKTPSCYIYPDTQSFYCFGCGTGGDVITFIKQIENLTFMEAVKLLAQRAGLEMPSTDSRSDQLSHRRTRIYEMNRLAANFFYKNLVNGSDRSGLKYFAERKLQPQTIKKYGLGYAPDSWNTLTDMLRSNGYSEEEIVDAWLGGRGRNGGVYDMFRKRVMFPIVDLRGNVIGFGGRVLDDSKPKYLNTAATPVFDKGANLFSMNFAKDSDSTRLILCEGYMDVIAVNQAGFSNAVATLGTAITPDQARLISHYAKEVIIAYDSDGAGQKATQKALNHFSDVGLQTRILHMENAKDPDEYIRKFGADRFRLLLDESGNAINFLLDRCEAGLDLNDEADKVEYLKRASKALAGIESKLEREVYISRTCKKCDIQPEILKSHIDSIISREVRNKKNNEWRSIKSKAVVRAPVSEMSSHQKKREARAEELIIYYLLSRPGEHTEIARQAPAEIFVTDANRRIYTAILEKLESSENFSLSQLQNDGLSDDDIAKIAGIIAKNRDIGLSPEGFADCAELLRKSSAVPGDDGTASLDDLKNLFSSKKKPQ